MGHTYSMQLFHIIFATKERRRTIDDVFRDRLYRYMATVAKEEFGWARIIGGTNDHLHALVEIRPSVSTSHAMSRWKSLSSGWMHRTFPDARLFAWQAGYSSFSVSSSRADAVASYIANQAEHHRKASFEDELVAILKRHRIEFDPQHVFDSDS